MSSGSTWPSRSRSSSGCVRATPSGPASWNLGRNYRWLCTVAVVEIAITTAIALLPTSAGGAPWNDEFSWKYVNYTPLVVGGTLLALWIAWQVRVKDTYTGPRTTVDLPPGLT